jgi:lipopolysaccharide/colanic/teichoic acid biosynthesis glycosyltransferase
MVGHTRVRIVENRLRILRKRFSYTRLKDMLKMLYRVVKRVIDLLFSILLWILFSPLMLIISVCIKVFDGGEVFVGSPKRLGKDRRLFFMYKFRTMVSDAHELVDKDELFKNHKLENDG